MIWRVWNEIDDDMSLLTFSDDVLLGDKFFQMKLDNARKLRELVANGISLPVFSCKELPGSEMNIFIPHGSGFLTTTHKVPEVMQQMLGLHCHMAIAQSPVAKYTKYFPKALYDAFCEKKSSYTRNPSSGIITSVYDWFLKDEAIGDAAIFGLQHPARPGNHIFVTDEFVDLYNQLSCTGLEFYEVNLV